MLNIKDSCKSQKRSHAKEKSLTVRRTDKPRAVGLHVYCKPLKYTPQKCFSSHCHLQSLLGWILTILPRFQFSFILRFASLHRIQKMGSCMWQLLSHCTQGEWNESIFKNGQYSQYPAGRSFEMTRGSKGKANYTGQKGYSSIFEIQKSKTRRDLQ